PPPSGSDGAWQPNQEHMLSSRDGPSPAPEPAPHEFSAGPGPDSPVATTLGRPRLDKSPLCPVHTERPGSGAAGDHTGPYPAPGGLGQRPTRRDDTRYYPELDGPL